MMRNPENDFYRSLSESTSLEDIEKVASTSIASIDETDMEKISSLIGSLGDEELQKLADELDNELADEHLMDPLADDGEYDDEDDEDDEDEDDEDYDDEDYDDEDGELEAEASEDEIEMIKLAYDEAYGHLLDNDLSLNDYIKDAYQVDLQKLAVEPAIDQINKIASENELNPLIVVDDLMSLWIKKSQNR